MPLIMPIKDLRNTTEISNIAHKEQEPIFITKNGYSDLVVMSSELYDKFARMNRIDQAIFESEQEIANGAEIVFAELEKKTFWINCLLKMPKDKMPELKKAILSLDTFHQSHQERNEGRYAGKGYRQLIIDNYMAIFRIDEPRKIVYVVTIQYQGRNL